VVSFTPGSFTHGERVPGIHYIAGWEGHRVCLGAMAEVKIPITAPTVN